MDVASGRGGEAPAPRRALVSDLTGLLAIAACLILGLVLVPRWARPALIDFGPNDADYIRSGFRPDWEIEDGTRFHWALRDAEVLVPIRVEGEHLKLNLRYRRHFVEPAEILVAANGAPAGRFEAALDPAVPYRMATVQLPALDAAGLDLALHADSLNPRPLSLALDWLEVARGGPADALALDWPTRMTAVILIAFAFTCLRASGLARAMSMTVVGLMAVAIVAGSWYDVVATERILREGAPTFAAVVVVAVLLTGVTPLRRWLRVDSPATAGLLVALTMLAALVRLALLLHPRFFYPDVRVHAIFAWRIAHDGLRPFLRDFTANQFQHSLGLQMENGHWYAFPYPPAFYVLCWPLVAFLHWRPEVAVESLAAGANSLQTLVVFAIARRLLWDKDDVPTALAAAGAVPLLPIFLARLTLAYFPAIVGQAVDSVVILYLAARVPRLDRLVTVCTLAALVCVALLTYTQSLLNFGILLPLFLILQVLFDREPGARRRQIGLFAAGALGAGLAMAAFYARYVPVFIDMRNGVPMAEEHIVLEKAAHARPAPTAELNNDDRFSGRNFAPLRGVAKAAWRLRIFYSWASPLVLAGLLLLWRDGRGYQRRIGIAWAITYLLLNVGSGSLPGPNLIRYNKDHEIVAPLFCIALACVGSWLWRRGPIGRVLASSFAASFWGLGAVRAVRYLTEKFWSAR